MNYKSKLKKHILVIGDVMLDKYVYCDANRISPEAPIPVLKYKETKNILGGAANVANTLSANGQKVQIMGLIGFDENGKILKELMTRNGIDTEFLISDNERATTCKTRYVSMGHQIFRFDEEDPFEVAQDISGKCFELIQKSIRNFDLIVISDYLKGFLTEDLTQSIIQLAKMHNKSIIVDPKSSSAEKYEGCTLIKPNKKEMEAFLGEKKLNDDNVIEEARILKSKLRCKYVLLTLGAKGMLFIDEANKPHHIFSEAKEVFDVTGAGDTVLSFVAMGFEGQHLDFDQIKIANKAAGIKVGKFGTSVVTYGEIEAKGREISKIKTFEQITVVAEHHRQNNEKIIFTNGCFDILHSGHVRYLRAAKEQGNVLIVGLNSDSSIKRLKGKERPILNEDERSEILSGLEFIDYIVIFEENTPLNLIKAVRPDVLVKGGDYEIQNIVGYKEVTEAGGQVLTLPFVEGKSTTGVIERIQQYLR